MSKVILPVCAGFFALLAGAPSEAAAPPAKCAAAGEVPPDLHIAEVDVASMASTLAMLGWNGAHSLTVQRARVVTGACAAVVTGFLGDQILLTRNLLTQTAESGAVSAARAAPRQPPLPPMNKPEADHGDHKHTEKDGLGTFVTGTRIAVKPSPQGPTEYFVGVWKGETTVVAGFASSPGGVLSPPAPLMRSTLAIRGVSYEPGADGVFGTLGIVQEAPGEVRLVSLKWSHQDFTK